MEYDWTCSKPAFLDFETRSEAELTTVHKYAKDPSTWALTCCIKVDGEMHRFGPWLSAVDMERMSRITEGRTIVAHNAPFDAAIWELTMGLPPRKWFDTLPAARAGGFPGKLDQLGQLIAGRGKEKFGKQLIDLLCLGRRFVPLDNPAYKLLLAYNETDVELLEQVYEHVKRYTSCEFTRNMFDVDRKMNDRGIPVSREHLEKLHDLFTKNKVLNMDLFSAETAGVNPNSPKQVSEWMVQHGFLPPGGSIGKYAMRELAKDPSKFYCGDGDMDDAYRYLCEIMAIRREVARVGVGKVEAALECLEADGRIYDMMVVWGAGTGRWSGRGPQFHNMPTNNIEAETLDCPLEYDAVKQLAEKASIKSREKHGIVTGVADVLCALLRHMVQADSLCVADYGAVELRGTAYLAGADSMLPILDDPAQSVYIDMGRKLFKREISKERDKAEYTLCKTLVLGSTYGMSGKKFGVITQTRTTSGTAMGSMKVDPKEAVDAFRKGYPEIPELWSAMHAAIHACAGRGEEAYAGKCAFYRDGPNMHMRLPSSREVVYRNARIEMLVPGYCKIYGMPEVEVPTVVYDSPRYHRAILYGSKQTENAVQGMCADLIADACVRSEAAGLRPIFTVHDELLNETDRLQDHMRIMSTPPEWAADFPLLAEGYCGSVWTKQNKRFKQQNAIRGRML